MAVRGPTNNHDEICLWAERQGAVPVELLPHIVDSEPALLRFMLAAQTSDRSDIRVLPWEEFFLKFDSLELTFVYDNDDGPYYEILKAEELSEYGPPKYRPGSLVH